MKNWEKPKPSRGMAHVVRRPLLPKDSQQGPRLPEDSREILLTPTNHPVNLISQGRSPLGKESRLAGGTEGTGAGSVDELTREDPVLPLPPLQLVRGDAPSEVLAHLVITHGNDRGRMVSVYEGETVIGRGVDCDVVLTDIAISRRHVHLAARGGEVVVSDLGSGNGTLVNDREIIGPTPLKSGDRLEIGNSVIRFEQVAQEKTTGDWPVLATSSQVGMRLADDDEDAATVAGVRSPAQDSGRRLEVAPLPVPGPAPHDPSLVATHFAQSRERRVSQPPPPPVPQHARAARNSSRPPLQAPAPIAPPPMLTHGVPSGELPNLSIPPTPSPAIPYPLAPPVFGGPELGGAPPQSFAPSMPPSMPASQGFAPPPASAAFLVPDRNSYGFDHGFDGHGFDGHGPVAEHGHMAGHGPMPPYGQPLGYPNQHSDPRAMHPGAMARPPVSRPSGGSDRRKLLLIISVALVLVCVAILAAVQGEREDEPVVAAVEKRRGVEGAVDAKAPPTTLSPVPERTEPKPAAGDAKGVAGAVVEKIEPSESILRAAQQASAAAVPEPSAAAVPEPSAAAVPEPSAAAVPEPSAAAAGTEPSAAAVTEPSAAGIEKTPEAPPRTAVEAVPSAAAATAAEGKGALLLASLTTGTRELPVSTWGTDEGFLRDLPEVVPDVRPSLTPRVEKVDSEPSERESPSPRSRSASRSRSRDAEPEPEPEPEVRRSSSDSGEIDRARSLYRTQRFEEAAEALRDAAEELSEDEADELNAKAELYEEIGRLMLRGSESSSSDPSRALDAYQRALIKDKKATDGVHQTLIRRRIGLVAPKAAMAHMVKQRFAEARQAADLAARYGESAAVASVLKSLERNAESKLRKALSLKKSGKNDAALKLLKEILRMAPPDSDVYEEAEEAKNELD